CGSLSWRAVAMDAPVDWKLKRILLRSSGIGCSVQIFDYAYVYPPADVTVPPSEVWTVRSTAPAGCGGDCAMIVVALSTVTETAGVPPKVTAAFAVPKLVPEIVTGVPPLLEPELGMTSLIVGPPGAGVEVAPLPAVAPGSG